LRNKWCFKLKLVKFKKKVKNWSLHGRILVDSQGKVIMYSFQFMRVTSSGFIEFVRFDLHKTGKPSEDAPHIHIRLESKTVSPIIAEKKFFKLLPLIQQLKVISHDD